jgi:hypothetical protein
VSEQVDLIVVHDHKLAAEMVKALKHAGIPCSEFWPEDIILDGGGLPQPARRVPTTVVAGAVGPFHVRVAEGELGKAREVLLKAGLTERVQSEAAAGEGSMREVARRPADARDGPAALLRRPSHRGADLAGAQSPHPRAVRDRGGALSHHGADRAVR